MTQASPRWDGHRMLFMLSTEDGREVRCAISRLALLGISGGAPVRSTDLPALFAAARPRIEAAALTKLRARSSLPSVFCIYGKRTPRSRTHRNRRLRLGAERRRG